MVLLSICFMAPVRREGLDDVGWGSEVEGVNDLDGAVLAGVVHGCGELS